MIEKIKAIDLSKIDLLDKENIILAFAAVFMIFGLGILGLIASIIAFFIVKNEKRKKLSLVGLGLSALKLFTIAILFLAFKSYLPNNNEEMVGDTNTDYYYEEPYGNEDFMDPFSDFYDMFPEIFGDMGGNDSTMPPENYS